MFIVLSMCFKFKNTFILLMMSDIRGYWIDLDGNNQWKL